MMARIKWVDKVWIFSGLKYVKYIKNNTIYV